MFSIVAALHMSLINSDVEHFFTCLLAICVSFCENVYSGLIPIF